MMTAANSVLNAYLSGLIGLMILGVVLLLTFAVGYFLGRLDGYDEGLRQGRRY